MSDLAFIAFISILTLATAYYSTDYRILDKNDGKMTYKNVTEIWLSHSHPFRLDKWLHYGDPYEKHLPRPVWHNVISEPKREIRLLEIGVQSGGSLIDWKRYYGDNSVIVGVDIDHRCMRSHMPDEKIFVEIGSQTNQSFLLQVCERYGPFNVIIDDGGHSAKMIKTSISALFSNNSCLSVEEGDSVYVIEDLHTSVMLHYFRDQKEFSHDILADAFHSMHSAYAKVRYSSPVFKEMVKAIHVYDSITFFQKSRRAKVGRFIHGNDSFPNDEKKLNEPGNYNKRKY